MGEGEVIECPECRSNEAVLHKPSATALGAATRTVVSGYECAGEIDAVGRPTSS